ncbi:MAG TPA: gamma-glutamylcyclotransferase [Thalassobaculum sp.]
MQDDLPPPTPDDVIPLTRENIRSGRIREWVAKHDVSFQPLSDDELRRTRAAMFPPTGRPEGSVWLFGYGSLIWNPAFDYAEKRPATVHGLHRRFCLQTHLGRGSRERPGLVLALDRGGSCRGVVFRIAPENVESELDIVWRREMISHSYRPTWVTAQTSDGPVRAIGFAINRSHERYTGALPEETVAETIAHAAGFLGPCCDYLFNTVEHLDELGMPDAGLTRLARRVREIREGGK